MKSVVKAIDIMHKIIFVRFAISFICLEDFQ